MKVSSLFFILIIAGTSLAYHQIFGDIPKAPALFKEWIATERLISKEYSNWEIEKASLEELLELLEEEIQTINEKLNSVEKENFGGEYHNSIFTNFKYAFRVDDAVDPTQNIAKQIADGNLKFNNNIFWNLADYDGTAASLTKDGDANELALYAQTGNAYINPFIRGISYTANSGLDPRPYTDGFAGLSSTTRSALPSSDSFFVTADYHGAFDPSASGTWMDGWSKLAGDSHIGSINTTDSDQDGDGLSFSAEVTAGTDPNDADTDNDGANDSADSSPLDGSLGGSSTTLTGGRLINLSTRGYVGTGTQRLIGGFRVYGGSLDVLVRGFEPSRANTDNLDDPTLTWKTNPASLLPSTSGIVSEVDDATGNSRLSGVSSDTQALLDVLVDKETADIQTVSNWDNNLSKGYTAFITTVTGTEEGIGRIGINDISDQTGAGQLVNISTRGYVGSSGTEYLIAGFQIRGGSVQVCIRAFGPSRSNDDALSDPQVELIQQVSDYHTTKTTLAWNDDYNVDYDDGTTQTANTASSIPTYLDTLIAKESAIVITLPNGNYTAKVSGVGGVTGIGRVGIDKVVE